MATAATRYAQPGYVRGRSHPARGAGPAPLPWGVAVLLIAALSGGLWLGIATLLGALF